MILLIGSSGFIGNAVLTQCLKRNIPIRAPLRNTLQFQRSSETQIIHNFFCKDAWLTQLKGVHEVVFVAGQAHNSFWNLHQSFSFNEHGVSFIAELAANNNVKRFVYLSTAKVHGNGKSSSYKENDLVLPTDSYSQSKLKGENALIEIANKSDMEFAILRPPLVYGPRVKANFLTLLKLVYSDYALPLAEIDNRRSLIYVENLVDALLLATKLPGAKNKIFLVSDQEDISTTELVEKLYMFMGRKPKLFSLPKILINTAKEISALKPIYYKLFSSLTVDSSFITTEIDWHPKFDLDESIASTVNWFIQEYGNIKK